jgi:glucose dehydrogenase
VFIGNGDFDNPTDTAVYAINADNGQEKWRYAVGDRVSSAPLVDEGAVYVTSTDGKLYALNTMDGSLNWSKYIGAGRGSPTVVNETVYSAGSDGVFALDKETGSEQWKYEEEVSFISNTPTVANSVLYIGLASANKVSAIDIDSGNEIWEFSTGNKVLSSPTHADGNIFIGNEDGTVFSIDARTGNENWQFSVGDETGSSPIVVDGTLYIGAVERDPYGGAVYAIDTDVSGSSNGSRANFGTLGHNEAWLGEATDGGGETDVKLRNVNIDPETVDGTTNIHTLTFDVVNLSADDGEDNFTITLPDGIDIDSVSIVDSGSLNPNRPDARNPIEFTVDPGSGDPVEIGFVVELELSPSTG